MKVLAGLVSFEASLLADNRLLTESADGISSSAFLVSLLCPNFLLEGHQSDGLSPLIWPHLTLNCLFEVPFSKYRHILRLGYNMNWGGHSSVHNTSILFLASIGNLCSLFLFCFSERRGRGIFYRKRIVARKALLDIVWLEDIVWQQWG